MNIEMDTSNWPERASLAEWGRITKISLTTLTKYRKLDKLPGKRLKPGKELSISKGTIIKAFNHQTNRQMKTQEANYTIGVELLRKADNPCSLRATGTRG